MQYSTGALVLQYSRGTLVLQYRCNSTEVLQYYSTSPVLQLVLQHLHYTAVLKQQYKYCTVQCCSTSLQRRAGAAVLPLTTARP